MSMSSLSAFLAASGALAPASSPGDSVISERKTILSAFTSLDLQLQTDANGDVVLKSSARDLLAQRKHEKAQEEMHLRQAALAKEQKKNAPVIESALSQAVGAFATENDEYFTPKAVAGGKAKGRNQSRRARQRNEKEKEKSENYSGKVKTRSTMQVKRAERKEKYKRVY
ncbi:hypothetical protein SPRG_03190 [Saprolegnia parasitica CBS 223.65]|uniref:Protein SDA1 n=1 Tax=Saprolegnia parasitica (strain CBS 223.65) TaxID=695850 RepID=A0A067CMP7_SAPPC|nr:hypothetical protein SPRG_03190 [Saprolegnia parasitica CBS 223.65]KDO31974.1 hypothetical protein SPRG_03190 [Saprolegnia parasitica CBS 223.65]|eukprot:XP_012197170.1 hypothetical protein SPRG_03190 [Saprolegnia parasitica CBS 223.65]